MKKALIQRAKYNKVTNLEMVSYFKELTEEQILKKRNICVMGGIKNDGSLFELVNHIVLAEIFLHQRLHGEGVKGEFEKEILETNLMEPITPSLENFNKVLESLEKVSTATIKLFESIDLSTIDYEDFSKPESIMVAKPAILIEQLFVHATYHRGQLSQMLIDLGIGKDFSMFQLYGVN